MGPKKKDGGEDEWRRVIENFEINDDNFRVQVVVMENAGSESDRLYLRKFENFAMEAKRFVIKNICQVETFFMISQLGQEKKPDPNHRVFVEGQAYLKEKQDIPSEILALTIKYLIIKMKQEYLSIKQQKIEVKEGMRLESATMLGVINARSSANMQKKKKGESIANLRPAHSTMLPSRKKYNTLLRVAGEEWRDKVYVDDYPIDGPNLYVVITGFGDPFLPISLIRIGVPLRATVQIRIDPPSSPSSIFPKRGQSQTEFLKGKSFKFWDDLQKLRINREFTDFLKDTAFIIYYPSNLELDGSLGNAETFYDELSYLMYDIQDLSRQHNHYLQNMDIINVPEDLRDEHYFENYCQNVEWIPLESITIFNILEGILKTVSLVCEVGLEIGSNVSFMPTHYEHKSGEQKKKDIAETLVDNLFATFYCTEADRKSYRLTYGDEYENYKYPSIIQHGNFVECSLFHVPNVKCESIIYSALTGSPINLLWEKIKDITDEVYNKIFLHLNLLLTCFARKDVDISELYRLIYILACRQLYNNKSSLKKEYLPHKEILEFKRLYLKRCILATPLKRVPPTKQNSNILSRSFSKIERTSLQYSVDSGEVDALNFIYDCPDIIELVSATEIANEKPMDHMIDDFEYFEDFSGIAALQIMIEAFNDYNCVDYKYSKITDSIILMFYNSHDNRGITNEEWRNHLVTPVCLQDFFDFSLEENYEWIYNEDKIMDEQMALLKPLEEEDSVKIIAETHCIDNTDVSSELLIEGSLKYEMYVAAESEFDEKSQYASRHFRTSQTSAPKISGRLSVNATEETIGKDEPKIFLGYDLGDRRVEVLGKDSRFFSKDGTRVSCSYMVLIPMELEYLILNINPGNKDNNFWIHKSIGDTVTPELKNKCKSFRITCRDQTLINLVANSYEREYPLLGSTGTMNTPEQEIKIFHSLYITLPNGLITQTIHKKQSSEISHIKQFFNVTKPQLSEKMRCVSLSGEVIIFQKSDEVEVLRPDGTYIKITQYDKQAVKTEEDANLSEQKTDTQTKSAKSAKAKSTDKKDLIKDTPLEYEIRFDAFEIVETNGIRKSYLNNMEFEIEKYLIRLETEYCLPEKYLRRMDGVNIFFDINGSQIVTFPNGTRIITDYIIESEEIYVEWTEEEIEMFMINSVRGSNLEEVPQEVNLCFANIKEEEGFVSVSLIYTVEHDYYTTVSINESTKEICITSPNKSTVTVYENLNYKLKLDNMTYAKFDGDRLYISYEACDKCKAFTECNVILTDDTDFERNWLELKDSYNKCIRLDFNGNIDLIDSEDTQKSTYARQLSQHLECSEICNAKSIRYFVLKRDLTCSELLHRKLVDLLRKSCKTHPSCLIAYHNALKGYRTLVSILEPVTANQTEKWIMDSSAVCELKIIKGKKSYYHWMRPYKRFVPKPRNCSSDKRIKPPEAFIMRLLELQWYPKRRPSLKGAKELLKAILEYRHLISSNTSIGRLQIPTVISPPKFLFLNPQERDYVDDIIYRICNDLKIFHKRDMKSRTALNITTKPPPEKELMTLDDELAESELQAQIRLQLYKDRIQVLKDKRRIRYWRMREEQWKQEQFYLYLLRAPEIAPYFDNLLGGAVWWDINYIAGKAPEGSYST